MPHISKSKIGADKFEEIYEKLIRNILQYGSLSTRNKILNELLTPTEKIMLAKRFSAICMLGEGFLFEDIEKVLKLSPSTISRYWLSAQKGLNKNIIELAKKRNKNGNVADYLLNIVAGQLRPIHSPRWKWLDEQMDR